MRIVFPGLDWSQKESTLTAERLHYCVHVHRMQCGEQVYVSDGAGEVLSLSFAFVTTSIT